MLFEYKESEMAGSGMPLNVSRGAETGGDANITRAMRPH